MILYFLIVTIIILQIVNFYQNSINKRINDKMKRVEREIIRRKNVRKKY